MDDLRGVTVSEGTMRAEDLIPAFADLLRDCDFDKYERWADRNVPFADGVFDPDDPEGAHWALDELFEALDTLSPGGYYFGANEGDGACYGFWEAL